MTSFESWARNESVSRLVNNFSLITSGESGRSNDAAELKGGGSRSDHLSARRERPSGPQRGKLSNDVYPTILLHSTRWTIPLFIVSSNRNPIDSPIVFFSVSGAIYAIFGRTKNNSHSRTRTWSGASQYPRATPPMVCLILTLGLVRFRSSGKRIHFVEDLDTGGNQQRGAQRYQNTRPSKQLSTESLLRETEIT